MTTETSAKQLPSRRILPKSDIALLKLSFVALAISMWTVLVVVRRWPRDLGELTFAGTVLIAPSIFVLSIWELVRYRFTLRGFLASLISAAATVMWVLIAFEVIRTPVSP